MPTQTLSMEIGKLIASVSLLQQEISEIKQQVDHLSQNLKREFVLRSEMAPVKHLVHLICATTTTGIIIALLNLILK